MISAFGVESSSILSYINIHSYFHFLSLNLHSQDFHGVKCVVGVYLFSSQSKKKKAKNKILKPKSGHVV